MPIPLIAPKILVSEIRIGKKHYLIPDKEGQPVPRSQLRFSGDVYVQRHGDGSSLPLFFRIKTDEQTTEEKA